MSSDFQMKERTADDISKLTDLLGRNTKSTMLFLVNNGIVLRFEDRRNLIFTPSTVVYEKNIAGTVRAFVDAFEFLSEYSEDKTEDMRHLKDELDRRLIELATKKETKK